MRVYFTPDFSRKVEVIAQREQNATKMLVNYLKNHQKADLYSHPTIRMSSTHQENLYIIKLHDISFYASFHRDERGEYMILVNIEK